MRQCYCSCSYIGNLGGKSTGKRRTKRSAIIMEYLLLLPVAVPYRFAHRQSGKVYRIGYRNSGSRIVPLKYESGSSYLGLVGIIRRNVFKDAHLDSTSIQPLTLSPGLNV